MLILFKMLNSRLSLHALLKENREKSILSCTPKLLVLPYTALRKEGWQGQEYPYHTKQLGARYNSKNHGPKPYGGTVLGPWCHLASNLGFKLPCLLFGQAD
ncbi:hypothetical protein CLV98_101430 [Dyadobacter jejuensis]|uniref:Uncharacterized protein n=1 Tax=Dyadobacter jejuensis TaxID=1082580 RepID=A0A316ASF8_9BACT|nr:hypothetical protein CLV98_101430 [Dyadobacter jejuensis]